MSGGEKGRKKLWKERDMVREEGGRGETLRRISVREKATRGCSERGKQASIIKGRESKEIKGDRDGHGGPGPVFPCVWRGWEGVGLRMMRCPPSHDEASTI